AVDHAKSRAIALSPQHPLMERGADLAAALDQAAVSIEKQLRVIDGGTVALVGADGCDDPCLLASLSDCQGFGRRYRQGFPKQALVLLAERYLIGPLQEGEIGIVG